MDFHPICLMLPEMTRDGYRALCESIRTGGLIRPITTYEDQILDGRHRYKACVDVGVEPRFEVYTGGNPAEHVRALHTRRNLTVLQQARLALAIGSYEHEREAAKDRQGKRTDIPASRPEGSAREGEALAHVSATTGVPVRTLRRAAFVEKHAIEEVRTSQTLSVSEAEEIAKLKPHQQRKVVQIENRAKRKEATQDARIRSGGAKGRSGKVIVIGPAADHSLGRKLLNHLERCWILAREHGLTTTAQVAARIAQDVDLTQPGNAAQFETARLVAEAIRSIPMHSNAA